MSISNQRFLFLRSRPRKAVVRTTSITMWTGWATWSGWVVKEIWSRDFQFRHKYVLWAGRWLFGSEWRWPKILAVLQILSTTAATSSPRTQGQRTRRDKWHLGKITHLRPLSNLKDFETTSWDKEPKILWTESNSTFNYLQWQSTQNYIHTSFGINKGVVVNFSRLPSKLSMSCQRCSK